MSRHLKHHEITALCEAYIDGENTTSIANRLGVSNVAICVWLKKRGIDRRNRADAAKRCSLNEDAFSTISEESAYWIGFLMADGNISYRSGAPELALVLSNKDRSHIEKFRAFLESTHALIDVPKTQATRFAVRSHKLVSTLAQYGVKPRKSMDATVIGLESNRHFWRGVIDGDGCIGRNPDGRRRLELVGSSSLLTQFVEFVRGLCPDCHISVRPQRGIFRVSLLGKNALTVIAHLYQHCNIALERKYIRSASAQL